MTYYAQSSPYGISTASSADALNRFETRDARRTWEDEDPEHRAAITRATARRWYPGAFRSGAQWSGSEYDGAPTGGVYRDI